MRNILVIEDTCDLREDIVDILEMEGFNVYPAGNGIDGMKLIHETAIDILLTDLLMPRMNGLEVLQFIRDEKYKIPVVVMSAKADPEEIAKCMDMGATNYLVKPYSPQQLLDAITESGNKTR